MKEAEKKEREKERFGGGKNGLFFLSFHLDEFQDGLNYGVLLLVDCTEA